jgi:transcriptional regulator GlxA family with amidase domain
VDFTRLQEMSVIRDNTARLHRLRQAVVETVACPGPDAYPEQLSNLIAETIAWVGRSCGQWKPDTSSINGWRTRAARQAQEFIEQHYRGPVRLEDLCRVTGVGARSLQRCFREYFDLTITDYLKTARLDAAYRALALAHPSQESVSRIAALCGFDHLGRFSVAFRERFGESPSQTLAERSSH